MSADFGHCDLLHEGPGGALCPGSGERSQEPQAEPPPPTGKEVTERAVPREQGWHSAVPGRLASRATHSELELGCVPGGLRDAEGTPVPHADWDLVTRCSESLDPDEWQLRLCLVYALAPGHLR